MDTNNTALRWNLLPFAALNPPELYALLQLRSRVFVVEQQCIFLDMDNLDQQSHHLLGYRDGVLVACARILPQGLAYPAYASIGRVVTAPEARGMGAGRQLMERAIHHLYALYGTVPIKIGAQLYLRHFYESLGFAQCGALYLEDGIEHIPMLKATIQ